MVRVVPKEPQVKTSKIRRQHLAFEYAVRQFFVNIPESCHHDFISINLISFSRIISDSSRICVVQTTLIIFLIASA